MNKFSGRTSSLIQSRVTDWKPSSMLAGSLAFKTSVLQLSIANAMMPEVERIDKNLDLPTPVRNSGGLFCPCVAKVQASLPTLSVASPETK